MTEEHRTAIEDRLRAHYRALREDRPEPVPTVDHRGASVHGLAPRYRVVAVAACLLAVLVAGSAYLSIRPFERGQPVEADLDVADDDTIPVPDQSPSPTVETVTGSIPVPAPTTTPADAEDRPGGGSTPPSDPSSDRPNADGSPVAPAPGTEVPPEGATLSGAYGQWRPGPHDTCSQAIHDTYWVYGPDGKVYPTYHPPIDPETGCRFGHEHGRDPAGSDLVDIPFPFGFVTEQAIATGSAEGHPAHEGHKIEWYNDGGYYESGSTNTEHDQICDVAYHVHLDSHSSAAFETSAHEVFHHARCENGAELIYRALHRFGNQGQFNLHCDQGAGPVVTLGGVDGDDHGDAGSREIPARACFDDQVLVAAGERSDWFPFDERWTLYQSVDSEDFGRFFIQFFFFVDRSARYWDGEALAHTVDLCYLSGERQVRHDSLCDPMRQANPDRRVAWDDPASPFNGANRQLFMGDLRLDNEGQQTDWYTDVHGGVWSAEPFPGSIRQHVGTTPIRAAASYRPSPIRSISFDDDIGIHAPN